MAPYQRASAAVDTVQRATFTSTLAESLAEDVLERFLRYVRIDTQSERDRKQSPSTRASWTSRGCCVEELLAIGLADAALDENGYVTATLAGTGPVVGLIAHVDTSPDAPGAGVEPLVHRAHPGGPIALPRGGTVIDGPAPAGHDIVTSSGDTLLGADDKAGVAEIVAAVAYLATHPELPAADAADLLHPDEEIGEGATLFDVEAFGAVCAYTLDGSRPRATAGRDVRRRGGHADDPRRRRPPGLGQGRARQRGTARGRGRWRRCRPS